MEQLLLQVDAIGVKLNKLFDGVKERVENLMRTTKSLFCTSEFVRVSVQPNYSFSSQSFWAVVSVVVTKKHPQR